MCAYLCDHICAHANMHAPLPTCMHSTCPCYSSRTHIPTRQHACTHTMRIPVRSPTATTAAIRVAQQTKRGRKQQERIIPAHEVSPQNKEKTKHCCVHRKRVPPTVLNIFRRVLIPALNTSRLSAKNTHTYSKHTTHKLRKLKHSPLRKKKTRVRFAKSVQPAHPPNLVFVFTW